MKLSELMEAVSKFSDEEYDASVVLAIEGEEYRYVSQIEKVVVELKPFLRIVLEGHSQQEIH